MYDANEDMEVEYNGEGPEIMEEEVRFTLKKMKTGKAIGADGVATEIVTALEDFGIKKVTKLLNKIYHT